MVFEPSASLYYGWELTDKKKLYKYLRDNYNIPDHTDRDIEEDLSNELFEVKFKKLNFKSIGFQDSNREFTYRHFILIKEFYVRCDTNTGIEEFNPSEELKKVLKSDLRQVREMGCLGTPTIILQSSTGVY